MRLGGLALCALLVGCKPDEEPEPQTGIYGLDGLEADLPTDDLEPFFDAVGDAKFVGLGESIHTSGGYYAAKTRLFRALVEEEGFRAIGFESPWDDALAVQQYVATCEGDPKEAVGSLFGVWQDTAVLEMVEWMCTWNQEHPDDTVMFWGWDIQQPWDDGRRLGEFLEAAAPSDAPGLVAGISDCLGVGFESSRAFFESPAAQQFYIGLNVQDHLACTDGLAAIEAYFDANEGALVAATSQDAMAWARVSLVGLGAWEAEANSYSRSCPISYEVRDVANAYVLQEIDRLSLGGRRSVIWAHNIHLAGANSAHHGEYGDSTTEGYCHGWTSMGEVLAGDLGDDWAPFALTGHEVAYRWFAPLQHAITPWDPRAVEVMLHDTGDAYAFADLAAPDSPFDDGDHELAGDWMALRDNYRGIVFLDQSEGMHWALRPDLPGTCAAGEVEFRGSVKGYSFGTAPLPGTTVCVVGGACTTADADAAFELCVPPDSPIALSFDHEGYMPMILAVQSEATGGELDMMVNSDAVVDWYYASSGVPYPPTAGTGSVFVGVFDETWQPLPDAVVTTSPAGSVTAYADTNGRLSATLGASTAGGGAKIGGLAVGNVDVTITHATNTSCHTADADFASPVDGAVARVPVVDGFDTSVIVQCTPP